jgi:hypothetical protein
MSLLKSCKGSVRPLVFLLAIYLHSLVPIHQKGSLRQSGDAAEALTVVGGIALERFTSMSPRFVTLKGTTDTTAY